MEISDLNYSGIINKGEIQMLLDWLPKLPKKIVKLYDTSIDIPNVGTFHQKCDKKGETLVLIKNDVRSRFGGYTSKSWDWSITDYVTDPDAFIFSLNMKKKYPVCIPEKAIFCNVNYGPTFGTGHDIYIANYCTQNNDSHTEGRVYPLEEKFILNNGERNFYVNKCEIYQIIYSN